MSPPFQVHGHRPQPFEIQPFPAFNFSGNVGELTHAGGEEDSNPKQVHCWDRRWRSHNRRGSTASRSRPTRPSVKKSSRPSSLFMDVEGFEFINGFAGQSVSQSANLVFDHGGVRRRSTRAASSHCVKTRFKKCSISNRHIWCRSAILTASVNVRCFFSGWTGSRNFLKRGRSDGGQLEMWAPCSFETNLAQARIPSNAVDLPMRPLD